MVPRGVLPPGRLMEGSGSLSVPCGAGDQESSAGQAGSKPTSASRDVHAGVIFSSSAILDLSQSGLHHFEEIFKVPNLRVSGQPLGLVHAGRVDVNEGFAHLQVSF